MSEVACGWSHTAFMTDQGAVYTSGNSDHGKLGLGGVDRAAVPLRLEGLREQHVLRIASYNEHTIALVDEASGLGSSLGAGLSDLDSLGRPSADGTSSSLPAASRGEGSEDEDKHELSAGSSNRTDIPEVFHG